MRVLTVSSMAVGAVILTSTAAQADVTGTETVLVENADWEANGHAGLDTYRIYLTFDDELQQLNAVFGNADNPLVMTSTGDGLFFNSATLNDLQAPADLTGAGIWSNQWDSYVTIDRDSNVDDATSLSPGFAGEVGDLTGDFTMTNGSWFITVDDAPQGIADGGRVLIAQLTVASGAGPNESGVAGTVHAQVAGGMQFTGFDFSSGVDIPAPGALALLGLAGFASRRRRRA